MKIFAKELVKYCKDNANEILSKESVAEQDDMMRSVLTCVLRPAKLSQSVEDAMTSEEYNEYCNATDMFSTYFDVDKAFKWVEEWVKA